MKALRHLTHRIGLTAVAFGFVALLLAASFGAAPKADAAQITSRSLMMSSSAIGSVTTGAAGSGLNGQKAKYTFTFTPTTASIGSLSIMFCTSPIPVAATCTTPTGFTAANVASIQSSSGLSGTFSLDTTTANPSNSQGVCNGGGTTRTNCTLLKWTAGAAQAGTPVTLVFGGGASDYITNPTTTGTFYARIATYSDTAYTTLVDNGSVANSTATQITVTAKVQETLNFSVGATPVAPGSTCASFADSGNITLGDPVNGALDFTQAYDNHSYFRISTNAGVGTQVYYSGDTLKSGANSIASIGESAAGTSSTPGTSQFGLAIDSSDTQSGSGHSFTSLAAVTSPNTYAGGAGTITSGGTAKFQFNVASLTTPIAIAQTSNVITCDTGSVRYIGNIATNTPPGIYTTVITYIAAPTY